MDIKKGSFRPPAKNVCIANNKYIHDEKYDEYHNFLSNFSQKNIPSPIDTNIDYADFFPKYTKDYIKNNPYAYHSKQLTKVVQYTILNLDKYNDMVKPNDYNTILKNLNFTISHSIESLPLTWTIVYQNVEFQYILDMIKSITHYGNLNNDNNSNENFIVI